MARPPLTSGNVPSMENVPFFHLFDSFPKLKNHQGIIRTQYQEKHGQKVHAITQYFQTQTRRSQKVTSINCHVLIIHTIFQTVSASKIKNGPMRLYFHQVGQFRERSKFLIIQHKTKLKE